MTITLETEEPVAQFEKDLDEITKGLGDESVRSIVDFYYQVQELRKSTKNQKRAVEELDDQGSTDLMEWLGEQNRWMEKRIKQAMGRFTDDNTLSAWAKSITGIGPVLSAGLFSHIDVTKAPTAGSVWRFAGLDPSIEWNKGEKRPFNAKLKTLCWKIGESFVKTKNLEDSFYGPWYDERKQYEVERNESGELKDQALNIANNKPNHAQIETYKEGRLPDGHINMRAKRWTVKLFLSHYHHVAHELEYDESPPEPYIIAHGDHAHYIEPPNW